MSQIVVESSLKKKVHLYEKTLRQFSQNEYALSNSEVDDEEALGIQRANYLERTRNASMTVQ